MTLIIVMLLLILLACACVTLYAITITWSEFDDKVSELSAQQDELRKKIEKDDFGGYKW